MKSMLWSFLVVSILIGAECRTSGYRNLHICGGGRN